MPRYLAVFVAFAVFSTSAIADNHRDPRLELRDKARACAMKRNTECANACAEAINLMKSGSEAELEAAMARCDAGYAPIGQERESAAAGTQLKEGYQWMPDVEARVTESGVRRRNPFVVEGRDEDWNKYCRGDLRYMAPALQDQAKLRGAPPGQKVLLKHVQYTTETKRTGQCVIGRIEILD